MNNSKGRLVGDIQVLILCVAHALQQLVVATKAGLSSFKISFFRTYSYVKPTTCLRQFIFICFLLRNVKFPNEWLSACKKQICCSVFPSLGNIIHNIINTIFGFIFLLASIFLSSHGVAYSFCDQCRGRVLNKLVCTCSQAFSFS